MSYIGNTPGVSSQRIVDTFIATAGQTTFTTSSGYTPGYVDVYYNGVKLVAGDDFTAATGSTIVLASGAALGDSVEIVAYLPRGLSDGYLKSEADARYVALTGAQTIAGVKTFSSQLVGIAGTAGAPAITTTGDLDTGIFFPAANTIAFATNGTEDARFDSAGNFIVGLTGAVSGWGVSPRIQVKQSVTSWAAGVVSFSSANDNAIAIGYDSSATRGVLAVSYGSTGAYSPLGIEVGGSERLRISTNGNVGINTASPAQPLHIVGGSSSVHIRAGSSTVFTDWGTDATGTWLENTGTSSATRAIRIQAQDGSNSYSQVIVSGGNYNITFANYNLECAKVERASMNGGWGRVMTLSHTFPVQVWNSNSSKWAGIGYDYSVLRGLAFWTDATSANVTSVSPLMQMGGGSVAINGSLSKSSGSFRIDHPLPQLAETHDLVHSFVEAPQADNLYRGKVTLVDGVATVNIDVAAGMTEGTFALLNREVQCFTTNETGWVHVRGSVTGNVLTIEAQDNACTDTISWMVIGERKDKHMYDTEWTDDNGKVIVEPLKEVRAEPPAEETQTDQEAA